MLEGEGPWEKQVWYGVRRFFRWLETRSYKMHVRVLLSKYRSYTPCHTCNGARLKEEALLWRLAARGQAGRGPNIHELMLLPLDQCQEFFERIALPAPLDEATGQLLGEVRSRVGFLVRVGLGYLTLDRQSRTLSGGEVQRINLTTALGTSLVNTLFVLDEPSIGLHPRDMRRVIEVMHRLRDNGNSLLVVEHDPQIMLTADRVIDMGPGPGEHGGQIVFEGTPAELAARADTLTARYLSGRLDAVTAAGRRGAPTRGAPAITIRGATEHNLKQLDVEIPLRRLVCVTGVSGSGKSTLVQDVLYAGLRRAHGKPTETPGAHAALEGADLVGDVVMVDQTQIGRTTRSNPASYVGAFDAIRKRFRPRPARRRTRLHARHVQLQLGQRALPDLRRQWLRARRDAVPLRRVPALPRLRRQALPAGDPRRDGPSRRGQGAQHRRRAGVDGLRGRGRSSPTTATCSTGSNRSRRSVSITCGSANRCRPCPAVRPSG